MQHQSYARAGVDVQTVRRIQRSLAERLETTFQLREGKVGAPLRGIGLYGGVVDLGDGTALTLHTDGVGTKVLVAQEMRRFDTIGIDCVAMTVNDLICLGSEPISLLDYIALQREDEGLVAELTKGLVEGARQASVAIVGGETAVMKDTVKGKRGRGFDLVSMGVGIVRKESLIDGSAIVEGDEVLGVASSGLHSNGFTLARRVFRRRRLAHHVDELGTTLGGALLEPTLIYVRPALRAVAKAEVHGIGHATGGSFSTLTRHVGGRALQIELSLPPTPPIFRLLMEEGKIRPREMYRTFNMGIGLCFCLPSSDTKKVARIFRSEGFTTHYLWKVKAGAGVKVNGERLA